MAPETPIAVSSTEMDMEQADHPRDPALDPANQHHHPHHNHTIFAEQGRKDNHVVYTMNKTFEKSVIPDQSPLDHSAGGSIARTLNRASKSLPNMSGTSVCRSISSDMRAM